MQFVALPLLIVVMLLCATCSQGVSAQNLSSMNNSNNNKTNLSGSSKTIIIPQSNKTLITTSPAAVGQINKSQSTNRTGFSYVSNLMVKDKTFPIKYNITNGKLLGMVADKDKTTLVLLLGGTLDNGKLTIELPRNVIDSKSQGNTDTKYNVKIDNRGVDYKEAAANLKARILQIDFSKNDRMMEISGTQMTS
jgi:hypothetical protein